MHERFRLVNSPLKKSDQRISIYLTYTTQGEDRYASRARKERIKAKNPVKQA